MSSLDKYERTPEQPRESVIIKVLMYITPSAIIILTSILLSS
jgi:hypothetical protein